MNASDLFPYDLDLSGEEELIRACLKAGAGSDRTFTFFDVGANRGDWTAYVLLQAEQPTSGHLFEVDSTMIERLTKRFKGSGLHLTHGALSDAPGEVQFRRYPNAEGVNTLHVEADYWKDRLESTVERAAATTGDAYCAQWGVESIDLLKIDTEGWEWPILHGFERMLSEHRVQVVQFEYDYLTADFHVVAKDFWLYLGDLGYSVGPLGKEGVQFRDFLYTDNDFDRWANFVAIPREALEAARS